MKGNIRTGMLAGCLTMLLAGACGIEAEEPAVSANTNSQSVAEEIAEGASANVIPAEALEYYALDYSIPEGFVRTADSTDTLDIYSSELENDYSYIVYMRQDNDGSRDYMSLTGADYKASIDASLSVNTVIESIERTPGDGNQHVKVVFSYSSARGRIELTEHIFITEKYLFEMVYARDPSFDWVKAFAESEAKLRLVNVAKQ